MSLILPAAIMAGTQAVGSVAGYFSRKNASRKAYNAGMDYAGTLKELSDKGIDIDRRMQGISSNVNTMASNARSDYLGQLASRGMLGSIAGQRGANQIQEGAMETIGNARTSLETEDERVKREALDAYNRAVYNAKAGSAQAIGANNSALASGLAGAVNTGVGQYQDAKFLDMYKTELGLKQQEIDLRKNNNQSPGWNDSSLYYDNYDRG